jgi:hypothetical protein
MKKYKISSSFRKKTGSPTENSSENVKVLAANCKASKVFCTVLVDYIASRSMQNIGGENKTRFWVFWGSAPEKASPYHTERRKAERERTGLYSSLKDLISPGGGNFNDRKNTCSSFLVCISGWKMTALHRNSLSHLL